MRLTPHGRLMLEDAEEVPTLDEQVAVRLAKAFAESTGRGLLQLGAGEVGQAMPPAFMWWRGFSSQYVVALCLLSPTIPDSASLPVVPPPSRGDLTSLVLTAPMMPGAEYITADLLQELWHQIGQAFSQSLAATKVDLQKFLKNLHPAWNLVGRVHFNLAENKRDPDQPFAFMATYTRRLSAQARAQHVPLGQALREYAGAANRDRLLSLLVPVQRAAETCSWLKPMFDAGEIFHPLRWSPSEAARLLASMPDLESAGVVVRMPANWRANRPPRPKVTATVGARAPSAMGLDAVLDFHMAVTLEGEPLTDREVRSLLAGTDNLVLLRGQWVEIDRQRLQRTMERFRAAEKLAERDGLTFAEAMRLLSGASVAVGNDDPVAVEWGQVTAGPWLEETLRALRTPTDGGADDPALPLKGKLRPYQKAGVAWLRLLSGLGLGGLPSGRHGAGQDHPDTRPVTSPGEGEPG